MANEASIIENPTSTPAAVSTGYQRQNTLITGIMNGIDRTVVDGGAGGVTVQISGPVDVNGVLYAITSAATLACPAAGKYIVYLDGTTGTLTPTLSTTLGTFNDSKNARYTAGGKRILNWLIFYDGTTAYVNRWVTPESDNNTIIDLDTQPEEWITSSGTWTAVRSKYYTIYVTGHGGGGAELAIGGGAGATGIKRIWIDSGDVWTAVMSTASKDSGGTVSFSDGVTTLTVQNGSRSYLAGGDEPMGFDLNCRGSSGGLGNPNIAGGGGGGSIYGGGGAGAIKVSANGGNGSAGGGGGGAMDAMAGYTQGAGGSGVIRVIG